MPWDDKDALTFLFYLCLVITACDIIFYKGEN